MDLLSFLIIYDINVTYDNTNYRKDKGKTIMDYLFKKQTEIIGLYSQIEYFCTEVMMEVIGSRSPKDDGYVGCFQFLGSDTGWDIYIDTTLIEEKVVSIIIDKLGSDKGKYDSIVMKVINKDPSCIRIDDLTLRKLHALMDEDVETEEFRNILKLMSDFVNELNKSKRLIRVGCTILEGADYANIIAAGFKLTKESRWYRNINPATGDLYYVED